MAEKFLPYGRQLIDDDDIAAVVEVLKGDYLTTGPSVAALETSICEATGAPHAVVCSNGTTALHLAYAAQDIGPGDLVIVPAITFLATANAARYLGADVRFADVDPATGLMTAETFEAALGNATNVKLATPVHLCGHIADLKGIGEVASARGIALIGDAAQGLGGTDADGNPCGSGHVERATTFSFHPVKPVTMGEGGAITTRDATMAERMRTLRSHGMVKQATQLQVPELAFAADGSVNPWYYEMPELGWNYRATDLQCALGLSQMRKLGAFHARRAEIAGLYDRLLAPLFPHVRPVRPAAGTVSAWHLYAVLIDFEGLGRDRASVMRALAAQGIGTQVHYIPVNRQPYYRDLLGDFRLPGAEAYYAGQLSLPFYVSLEDADVARVVETLAGVLGFR